MKRIRKGSYSGYFRVSKNQGGGMVGTNFLIIW